jgi:hypothetical protein
MGHVAQVGSMRMSSAARSAILLDDELALGKGPFHECGIRGRA